MHRMNLACFTAICLGLATSPETGSAQQAAHSLPQALPGTSYAAQLTIPPGLGYPFAHCELSGKTPRWLTIDCARLRLNGKVPVGAAGEGDYQLTLRVEDSNGNSKSFPLALRVSAEPQVVALGQPEMSPKDEPSSGGVGQEEQAPVEQSAPDASTEAPANVARTRSSAMIAPVIHNAALTTESPTPAERTAPSDDGIYASDLRAATAALHAAKQQKPPVPKAQAAAGVKPDAATVPKAAAPPPPVALPVAAVGYSYSVPIKITPPAGVAASSKATYSMEGRSPLQSWLSVSSDEKGNWILTGKPTDPVGPTVFSVLVSDDGVAQYSATYMLQAFNPPADEADATTNSKAADALPVKNNPVAVGQPYAEKLGVKTAGGCKSYSAAPQGTTFADWALDFNAKTGILSSNEVSNTKALKLPTSLVVSLTCNQTAGGKSTAFVSIPFESARPAVVARGIVTPGKPVILQPLNEGATTISVAAPKGVYLTFYSVPKFDPVCDQKKIADIAQEDRPAAEAKLAADKRNPCVTQEDVEAGKPAYDLDKDNLSCFKAVADPRAVLLELKTSATNVTPITTFTTVAGQVQTVNLQQSLIAGTRVCAIETADPATPDPSLLSGDEDISKIATVQDTLDWGRVRAYFVGGVLISNTDNSFSTSAAHQFLDLNVDKFWYLPDCAIKLEKGDCKLNLFQRRPGLSTYFDTRLTAIPVSAPTTTPGSATITGSSLTSQQTAKVQVGAYLPILVSTWNYNQTHNGLYWGPIAKVGFDTVTGTTTPTTTLASSAGSTTTQANLDRVYNFYSFGARIGHFGLYPTRDKAPELQSYLDINFGPYSNLPSYICQPAGVGLPAPTGTSVSSCAGTALPNATEKRIWRLDLEGLLKIPSTPLVLGFNANIGQRSVGSQNLDTLRIPKDDVRFLFGTKFDIATVMKKLGVGQ